ncbi:hypothetical protein CCP3SC5AM1_880014 [Gammaproteobacteria bacterium]
MKLKDRKDFIFSETLSELPLVPKTEEQSRKDLFKGFDPEKIMDAYEEQLGIKVKAPDMPRLRYRHIMLSPGVEEDDSQLFDQLMNDNELYQIINRTSYWTPRGEFKLFLEYTENLDVKKDREKQKEKTNE